MSLDPFEKKNAHGIYLSFTLIEKILESKENQGWSSQEIVDALKGFLKVRKEKLLDHVGFDTIYTEIKIKDFDDGQRNKKSKAKKRQGNG